MDEQVVARLVRAQHGVASCWQLRRAGIGGGVINHRCRRGSWRVVHRGVYALGHLELTQRGIWMAAVLACGEGAALSHRSAAELWGLVPLAGQDPHVTVPSPNGRAHAGIDVHRLPALAAADVTRRDSIPVTMPALALIDSALALGTRGLERAIDEGDRLRLLNRSTLEDAASTYARRPGRGLLCAVLSDHAVGSTLTRSHLEELFLALCRRHDLPKPLVNVRLEGITVDFYWPDHGLVVETDGRASHDTPGQFQRDRDRNNRLMLTDLVSLRFTYRDVTKREAWTVSQVRKGLRKGSRRLVHP